MFTFDPYRDVLSDHAGRGHIVGAAWVLAVAVVALAVVLFA
jgi:hypothetical protein